MVKIYIGQIKDNGGPGAAHTRFKSLISLVID
jgi:hypothetical protein